MKHCLTAYKTIKQTKELIEDEQDALTTVLAVSANMLASSAQFNAGMVMVGSGIAYLEPTTVATGLAIAATSSRTGQLAQQTVVEYSKSTKFIAKKSRALLIELADFIVDKFEQLSELPICSSSQIIINTPSFSLEFTPKETKFITDIAKTKVYTDQMATHFETQLFQITQNHDELKNINKTINKLSYQYDETNKVFLIDFETVKDDFMKIVSKYHPAYFEKDYKEGYSILESAPKLNVEPSDGIQWLNGDGKGSNYAGKGNWEVVIPICSINLGANDYRGRNGGGGIMCNIL